MYYVVLRNPNFPKSDELTFFKARNLGDIICDNTAISTMRNNVFVSNSPTFGCGSNAKLDLNLFD